MSECAFPGCGRPARAKGWCESHYRQSLRDAPLRPLRNDQVKPECAAPECHNLAATKGMCSAHYQRAKRYGDPTAGRTPNGAGRKTKAKRKAVKMPKGWDKKTEPPKLVRPAIEDIHIDVARALTPEEIALTLRLLTRHGQLACADALGIAS